MARRVGEAIKIHNVDRDHTYKADTELWLYHMTRTNPGMSRKCAVFLLPISGIIINGRGMPCPSVPKDVGVLIGCYKYRATEKEQEILEELTEIYFNYIISEEDFGEIEVERKEKDFIYYCEALRIILARVGRR